MTYDVYTAVLAIPKFKSITTHDDLIENIEHHCELIKTADLYIDSGKHTRVKKRREWAPIKLVSFPESSLHGWPIHSDGLRNVADRYEHDVLIEIPGEETQLLAEAAKRNNVYLSATALEKDPNFPGLQFNCGFIINPNGEIIHKYRKVMPWLMGELSTSPVDVLDEYMATYGEGKSVLETLYPVTDTEIGKLGIIICNDGSWPESYRALAMNGAEIIIRPGWLSNVGTPPLNALEFQDRNAARTNMSYVIHPVNGPMMNHDDPPSGRTLSEGMIVDYNGKIETRIPPDHDEHVRGATIRLDHLRRRRLDAGWNYISQMKNDVWRQIYEADIYPSNLYLDEDNRANDSSELYKRNSEHLGLIDKLLNDGIFTEPLS